MQCIVFWLIAGISASIFSVLHWCQGFNFFFFFLTMQTFFLKSLIHNVSCSWRKWEASIHQQQMKRNCAEGVPREGWIWRSHHQLGYLVSLKTCVTTLTGFYAFLYILSDIQQTSDQTRNNVVILCGGLSLSWNAAAISLWAEDTVTISIIQMAPSQSLLACQEGIAALPSLLCAEGFYFSTKFTSPHSDFEEFQYI